LKLGTAWSRFLGDAGPAEVPSPRRDPFDAGAIQLHDEDRPTDTRHTVSLFVELFNLLRTPPHLAKDKEERSYIIRAYTDELEKRGFSREDLRKGAASVIGQSMVSMIVVGVVLDHVEADDTEPSRFELNPAWQAIRRSWSSPDDEHDLPHALSRILSVHPRERLITWNLTRTIEELIEWSPPPLPQFLLTPIDFEAVDGTWRGSWLFDRFTRTYLQEWADETLDLEWKYIHSGTPGCGNPNEMALRRIETNELAIEIVHRTVDRKNGSKEDPKGIHPADFTFIALDHLQAGRYETAVALYEGIHILRPGDAVVLNNLGFCLIPCDLSRAIVALEESVRLAPKPRSLTYANLACAYFLKGEHLKSAEAAVRSLHLPAEQHVWLWEIDEDDRLTLSEGMHTEHYAQALCDRLREGT
jgi:tetratricopeptide (TPR) repeat protein